MHSDKRSPASPRTVRSPLPEDGSVAENPTIDSFFDVKKREHMAATPPTPTSRFSWFSWNKGGNAPIANGDTLRFGEEQSENNLGSSTAVSPGSPPTPGTVLHRTSSISSIISASGSSRLKEIGRQGRVFFDDDTTTDDTGSESENEGGHRSGSFEEEGGRIDEDMEEEEEEDWLRSNEAEFVESAGRAVL